MKSKTMNDGASRFAASAATNDAGRVRLGAIAKTLPQPVRDAGRVRLGAGVGGAMNLPSPHKD